MWIYDFLGKVVYFFKIGNMSPWNAFISVIIFTLAKICLSLWHLHDYFWDFFWDFLWQSETWKININTHKTLTKTGNFSSQSICHEYISLLENFFIYKSNLFFVLENMFYETMMMQNYYLIFGSFIAIYFHNQE